MKYLTKFDTANDYNTYATSLDYTNTPNISGITGLTTVYSTQLMPAPDYSLQYFTIEFVRNGMFSFDSSPFQYSTDNGTTWNSATANQNISGSTGDKVLIKQTYANLNDGIVGTIQSMDVINVYGNIMSLIYGDNFVGQTSLSNKDMVFSELFKYCGQLDDVSNLILPATTLSRGCYQKMFSNCPYITKAPELPATILANNCYMEMFEYCMNLNYIKCLANDYDMTYHMYNWVVNVSNNGIFVKASDATGWTTGDSGIPSGWTIQNV